MSAADHTTSAHRALGLPPMAAAIAGTTVAQLPVFLTGALAVQIGDDIHLPAAGLGIAVAAFFVCSAGCSGVLGRVSDRLGGPTIMRWGLVPTVVASLLLGLVVHHWLVLAGALFIAGAANGTVQPAANRHLARAIPRARQGAAFGVKQAAIPASTLLAGLSVPAVGHTVGWRWAFLGTAVLAVIVGALIPRPPPTARGIAARHARVRQTADAPFARRALVTLAIGVALGAGAANAMGTYFVVSATASGISDSTAGFIAAAGSVVSLLTRLVIGFRADRRATGHLRLVAAMAIIGAIGPLLLATGQIALLLVAAVVGYGAGWGWAGLFNFSIARTHPTATGRATGMTGVGGSIGGCIGPLAFGFVTDHLGYGAAWVMIAAAMFAAGLMFFTGRRMLYAAGVVTRPDEHGNERVIQARDVSAPQIPRSRRGRR